MSLNGTDSGAFCVAFKRTQSASPTDRMREWRSLGRDGVLAGLLMRHATAMAHSDVTPNPSLPALRTFVPWNAFVIWNESYRISIDLSLRCGYYPPPRFSGMLA